MKKGPLSIKAKNRIFDAIFSLYTEGSLFSKTQTKSASFFKNALLLPIKKEWE
jgi:hypothetical protein